MEERNEALSIIKDVCEEGLAEINGRTYVITKTNHAKRRQIFAFFSAHNADISASNYSFLDSTEFDKIESVINNIVTFEGQLISKIGNHWDTYPEDYLMYIMTMMGAISYPFLKGNVGN